MGWGGGSVESIARGSGTAGVFVPCKHRDSRNKFGLCTRRRPFDPRKGTQPPPRKDCKSREEGLVRDTIGLKTALARSARNHVTGGAKQGRQGTNIARTAGRVQRQRPYYTPETKTHNSEVYLLGLDRGLVVVRGSERQQRVRRPTLLPSLSDRIRILQQVVQLGSTGQDRVRQAGRPKGGQVKGLRR